MSENIKTRLSPSEEELMHIFWVAHKPLTSIDILQISEGSSWNGNYLHKMLRQLQKKGFLSVCGMVQYANKYARQFIPTMTKEEYTASIIALQGVGLKSFAKIALALAKNEEKKTNQNSKENESLITSLEKIIEDFTEQEE